MAKEPRDSDLLFEVQTPLGFGCRVTHSCWERIVSIKHPVMSGCEAAVRDALRSPEEVRQSRKDSSVYLFYAAEKSGRWICAVVRQLDGDGFLITAYPTDAIKEGVHVWPK